MEGMTMPEQPVQAQVTEQELKAKLDSVVEAKKAITDKPKNELTDGDKVRLAELGAQAKELKAALKALKPEVEPETKAETGYTPPKGTERMVHAVLVKGKRFDPATGKEISKPYTQLFTFSEWQVFEKNHANLGIEVKEVLYNPFN